MLKHSTGVNAPISNLVITGRHLITNRGLSIMGDVFPFKRSQSTENSP